MKKMLLMLFLIPCAAHSQIGIAAKTGLNMTYLHFDGAEALNMKASPFFGLSAEFKGLDIAGELELNYSSLESKWQNSSIQGMGYEQKASFQNFKTFVMFKYYPVENFNVKFGSYIGFESDSKYELRSNSIDAETEEKINSTDIGLCIGMEAKIYKGIFVDARIALDLAGSDDVKSENLLFGTGYRF